MPAVHFRRCGVSSSTKKPKLLGYMPKTCHCCSIDYFESVSAICPPLFWLYPGDLTTRLVLHHKKLPLVALKQKQIPTLAVCLKAKDCVDGDGVQII